MDHAEIKRLAPMASRLAGRALPRDPYELAAFLENLGFRIDPTYRCHVWGAAVVAAWDRHHDRYVHNASSTAEETNGGTEGRRP